METEHRIQKKNSTASDQKLKSIIKSLNIKTRVLLLESITILALLATLSMKEEQKGEKSNQSKQRPLGPVKLIRRVKSLKPSLRILLLY